MTLTSWISGDKARKETKSYLEFYKDYGFFFKEGIITSNDQYEKEEIAKLLRFESSSEEAGKLVSCYLDTCTALSGKLKWEKISGRFEGCYENALVQSFEMSPHLVVVWILNPQTPSPEPIQRLAIRALGWKLQTIKRGLISKLWMMAFP